MAMQLPSDEQHVATIIRLLGDCRMTCQLMNGDTKLGHVRGKIKKRCRIKLGDVVLVSERDDLNCGDKVDILYKYKDDEIRELKKRGMYKVVGEKTDDADDDGDDIVFTDDFTMDDI